VETEDDVRADARTDCSICKGAGWHWGWDAAWCPVRLRCPCVDIERAKREVASIEAKKPEDWKRLKPERIELSAEDYHALVRTLENPPKPNAKLKALMRRKPVWER
jgi:Protein of unknown function (DUF1778)